MCWPFYFDSDWPFSPDSEWPFSPDANNIFHITPEYVRDLGDIYAKHQSDISKDSELIRLAIRTVISLEEVWKQYPRFLIDKKAGDINKMDDEKKMDYLTSLTDSIYCTRNEIAHAKANYEKKGPECPDKDRYQFTELLDYIAVRCIRWFGLQPEEKRVVIG